MLSRCFGFRFAEGDMICVRECLMLLRDLKFVYDSQKLMKNNRNRRGKSYLEREKKWSFHNQETVTFQQKTSQSTDKSHKPM